MGGDIALTPALAGARRRRAEHGRRARAALWKRAVQALDIAACCNSSRTSSISTGASAILAKCEAVARAHYPELL